MRTFPGHVEAAEEDSHSPIDAGGRLERRGQGASLARQIRDRRYAIGWGPEDLASRAGISRTALYHIESGQTLQPRAQTLMSIAQALGVEIADLLGDPEATAPGPGPSARDEASRSRNPAREVRRKFEELLASPMGPAFVLFLEAAHELLSGTGPMDAPTGPEAGTSRRFTTGFSISDHSSAR